MKQGHGEFITSRGERYAGQWRKDKRYGAGKWFDMDERNSYDGEWLDDLMHGEVTLISG